MLYSLKITKKIFNLCLANGLEGDGHTPPEAIPTQHQQEVIKKAYEDNKHNLDKYGVDLQTFTQDIQRLNSLVLKNLTDDTRDQQEKARLLFQEYLKANPDKLTLRAVTESTNSPGIKQLSEKFEKFFEEKFKDYKFLDPRTQEYLKMGMLKAMIEGNMGDIVDSTLGSFYELAVDGFKVLKDKIPEAKPDLSGRLKILAENFDKYIKDFTDKFDEIQKLTPQLEVSKIEWFRNPELISKGIEGLDLSKKVENDNLSPEETQKINEFAINLRDKVVETGNKIDISMGKIQELMYQLGPATEGILGVLFKIPLIGELLAGFLGLNPQNAITEFKENGENYRLFSTLKGLGKSEGKEGEGVFKDIDTSKLEFSQLKTEMKELKSLFPELKEDGYKKMLLEAFRENGYQNGSLNLKLELTEEVKNNKELSNTELTTILRSGIDKYRKQEAIKINDEIDNLPKIDEITLENKDAINKIRTDYNTLSPEIQGLITEEKLQKLKSYEDKITELELEKAKTDTEEYLKVVGILVSESYNKYKEISLSEIKKNDVNIEEILKKAIEENYNRLNLDSKKVLLDSITIIKEYLLTKEQIPETIGNLIEDKDFQEFLKTKRTEAEKNGQTPATPSTPPTSE